MLSLKPVSLFSSSNSGYVQAIYKFNKKNIIYLNRKNDIIKQCRFIYFIYLLTNKIYKIFKFFYW